MTTAVQWLASHRLLLAEGGEDIEIRRYSGEGNSRAIATRAIARGKPVGMGSQQLVGETELGTRRLIVINDPAAAVAAGNVALSAMLPITTADKLYFRGRELAIIWADDDTKHFAGVLIALIITARG